MNAARPDLSALFRAHAHVIARTVHRMTQRPDLAQEVVQETFLFAHEHLDELVDGPGIRSWLFQVALNRMRHKLRAAGRYEATVERFGHEPPAATPQPDGEVRRKQDAARIAACVLDIPLAYREAFVLFEIEEIPGREVAEMLGIETATLWSRLSKGRAAFREAWHERGFDV